MNEEQFKKELSELLDTLPRPEFGINCIIISTSELAYNEFNRMREEFWEKFIKDENFQKQKFKEQEEIRDEYYKLLDNV